MTLSCDARTFIKVNNSKELLVFGFEGNKFYDRQYNWEKNGKQNIFDQKFGVEIKIRNKCKNSFIKLNRSASLYYYMILDILFFPNIFYEQWCTFILHEVHYDFFIYS